MRLNAIVSPGRANQMHQKAIAFVASQPEVRRAARDAGMSPVPFVIAVLGNRAPTTTGMSGMGDIFSSIQDMYNQYTSTQQAKYQAQTAQAQAQAAQARAVAPAPARPGFLSTTTGMIAAGLGASALIYILVAKKKKRR